MTTNGHTIFANASTCTLSYRPSNPALVFDLKPPRGKEPPGIGGLGSVGGGGGGAGGGGGGGGGGVGAAPPTGAASDMSE